MGIESQQSSAMPAHACADLYLVGAGIGPVSRMTGETAEVISGADIVFHLTAVAEELEKLNPGRVRSLQPVYESSDVAVDVYAEITRVVVDAAEQAKSNAGYACWVTYGHPLWLVDSSYYAMRECRTRGLHAICLPAVSSMDTLLIDSPVDLGHGAQMLETSRFVHSRLTVDPRVPLVLFQAGDFGTTRLRSGMGPSSERFKLLEQQLLVWYRDDHPAHIVLSAWRAGMRARVTDVTVGTLTAHAQDLHTGTTLVIPPQRHMP